MAPQLISNMGNMGYEDWPASLFSGEHVLSQGIYVVDSRVMHNGMWIGINGVCH